MEQCSSKRTTERQRGNSVPTESGGNPGGSRRCSQLGVPLCPATAVLGMALPEAVWHRGRDDDQQNPPSLCPALNLLLVLPPSKPKCSPAVTFPAPTCSGAHAKALDKLYWPYCSVKASLVGHIQATLGSGKAQVTSSREGMARNKSQETE